MKTISRNLTTAAVLIIFITSVFSCKKDIDNNTAIVPDQLPDLATKISSSVSGFVTDENNAVVSGATVNFGIASASTDEFGYFKFDNVEVAKTAATVTVKKTGYFNAIKTYAVTGNKAAFFRIKLLRKTIAGTISATTGGNVSLSNGMNISFPVNAIKDASNGSAYNGTVNVAVQYIDPTSDELVKIMPGDLRGINDDGYMKGLTSFGMMAAELTGDAGQLLQIADGKKSTLTMPVPAAALASAPTTIPLWYFDEAKGLWKEEGSALKTGNTYVGEVSHFSYWNCDLPDAIVPLTFSVVGFNGNGFGNAHIEIRPVPGSLYPWSHIGGYTESSGYVSVFVTANTTYTLEIIGTSCQSVFSSQTFSIENSPVNLGNISVGTQHFGTLSGTVTDCNNNPLTNGRIILHNENEYTIFNTTDGAYHFSAPLCYSPSTMQILTQDLNNSEQGVPTTFSITEGANSLGNLQACGYTGEQYLTYSIDGVATRYVEPADSFRHWGYYYVPTDTFFIAAAFRRYDLNIAVNVEYIASGIGNRPLFYYWSPEVVSSQQSPAVQGSPNIHFTEYGAVGEFITGSFTGAVVTSYNPNPVNHTVSCSFRVRRG